MEKENSLTLIEKLAKIRKLCEVITKDAKGYGYKYASLAEIQAKVSAGMDRYRVELKETFIENSIQDKLEHYAKSKVHKDNSTPVLVTEKLDAESFKALVEGTNIDVGRLPFVEYSCEYWFSADVKYTWVNLDNPEEKEETIWHVTGSSSDPAQAMGSALTYGKRYFYANYFHIALVEDDPDNWRSKQKEAQEAEEKSLAEQTLKLLDEEVKTFLANNPDKRDEVAALIKTFVKNGNYFSIKESSLAGKLLSTFEEKFIKAKAKK